MYKMGLINKLVILISFCILFESKIINGESNFSEELYLKTLNDLNVYFHFEFKTILNEKQANSCKLINQI